MHIDYLKRVEKMLALPVERLVGNSSSSCNNSLSTTTASSSRRMSLSPDSSNSQGSISSTVSETGGESGKCYCPKIISPPPAESSRHMNKNKNNNNEDDQVRIKVESPEDDLGRPCHNNRFPINNRKSGEDKDVNHSHNHSRTAFMPIRPSAQNSDNNGHQSHKRSKDHRHDELTDDDDDNDNSDDDEGGDIDVDGDDDNKSNHNKISPATTTTTTTNTATMCGGSSFSSSGTNSSPCFNFRPFAVSNFGLNLSSNVKNGKSETAAASLKFSIEDILRPDFGLTKFQLLAQHHHQQQQQIKRARIGPLLPSPGSSGGGGSSVSGRVAKGGSSSVSSTEGHRPYKPGPGSVIYHSEDSNGSCSSSRREPEVVDDTKVNPPVPEGPLLWPAWVYCTRYSDRPSSGPRSRRIRKSPREIPEEKRPRTAFTGEQLSKLKKEFDENRYLTEKRRQDLARDLKLHENQIKIWFQNKRAKLKKSTGTKNGLAMQLMAQGLYNHSTVPVDEDDEMMMEMM